MTVFNMLFILPITNSDWMSIMLITQILLWHLGIGKLYTYIHYTSLLHSTMQKNEFLNNFSLPFYLFFQWTPLHVAAKEGHDYTVECLVKKGAQINTQDKNGVRLSVYV